MSASKRPTAPVRPYADRARLVKHIRRTLGAGVVANDVAAEILLEYYSAKHGVAWPAEATLADHLRTSTRTIKRAVRDLEAHGFFTVKRAGAKGVNHYIPRFDCLPPAKDDRTNASAHDEPEVTNLSHQENPEVTNLSPKMGQICPAEVTNLSPDSSYESPQESSYSLSAAGAAGDREPATIIGSPAGDDPVDLAVDAYRIVAEEFGLEPPDEKISPAVRKAVRARLRESSPTGSPAGGLAGWEYALDKIRNVAFLRGEGGGFRVCLDWLCKPANFKAVMRGRYFDPPKAGTAQQKSKSRSFFERRIAETS